MLAKTLSENVINRYSQNPPPPPLSMFFSHFVEKSYHFGQNNITTGEFQGGGIPLISVNILRRLSGRKLCKTSEKEALLKIDKMSEDVGVKNRKSTHINEEPPPPLENLHLGKNLVIAPPDNKRGGGFSWIWVDSRELKNRTSFKIDEHPF